MITALIEGIILGITLAFLVGPAFIALVQTSIYRGLAAGVQFSIGIVFSDLTLIALSYLGVLRVLGDTKHHLTIGLIGGGILIAMGFITFKRKKKLSNNTAIKTPFRPGNIFKYVFKGFFLNIFNPFLLIFWISVVSLVTAKYGIETPEMAVFFIGTLTAVFVTDIIKCLASNKIRKLLNFKVLTYINRAVGITLITFGLVLIIRVILLAI